MNGATLEVDRRILEQIEDTADPPGPQCDRPRHRDRRSSGSGAASRRADASPSTSRRATATRSSWCGRRRRRHRARAEVRAKARAHGLLWQPGSDTRDTLADLVFESGSVDQPHPHRPVGPRPRAGDRAREDRDASAARARSSRGRRPGARFSIVLPATLASFRGLLVRRPSGCSCCRRATSSASARIAAAAVHDDDTADHRVGDSRCRSCGCAAALRAAAHAAREPRPAACTCVHGRRRCCRRGGGAAQARSPVDEVLVGDQEVLVEAARRRR